MAHELTSDKLRVILQDLKRYAQQNGMMELSEALADASLILEIEEKQAREMSKTSGEHAPNADD